MTDNTLRGPGMNDDPHMRKGLGRDGGPPGVPKHKRRDTKPKRKPRRKRKR